MSMTKEDFVLVADALIKELRYYSESNAYVSMLTENDRSERQAAINLTAYQMAESFSKAYPHFDKMGFLDYIHDKVEDVS